MSVKCVVCQKIAEAGKSLRTDCGHWTHTECWRSLQKPKDYDNCPQCLGYVDVSRTVLPEHEPNTDDGVDYVLNPPTITKTSMLRSAATNILKVLSRNNTVDTTNPFSLLSHGPYQMPIDSIIRDHNIGLQHMIKAGVTIDDFLANGYALKDMQMFKDLSGDRGEKRAQQALYALKMTADHLKSYGTSLLPVKTLRDELGVTPEIICSMYGLECPAGGYVLASPASEDWTARDLVDLGFNIDDLMKYGKMHYLEQYVALAPTEQDEADLGVTMTHLKGLPSLEEELRQKELEDQMEHARRQPPLPLNQREQLLPTPASLVVVRNPHKYVSNTCDAEDEKDAIRRRTRHGLRKK